MKILVIATALVATAFAAGIVWWGWIHPLPMHQIQWGLAATMGSAEAPVDLVVIEDFLCPSCRSFHETHFPQIQRDYIDSGKARYTVVPIAVVRGSTPLANAALAVYQQSPDLFFPYADKIFEQIHRPMKKMATQQELLSIAQELGKINTEQLKACIDSHCNRDVMERNLEWAHHKMGSHFVLPALYMNGKPTTMAEIAQEIR